MDTAKKSVYIESTIPSYATARTSNDLVQAAWQSLTNTFWNEERHKYDLYTSQYVINECRLGDPEAAQRRLDFLRSLTFLVPDETVDELAAVYQKLLQIPDHAKTDCQHLAICVVKKMDFLLTWNCTHLGLNSFLKVKDYNDKHQLWTPLLVTPEYFVNFDKEV
jgi:hypothetical protein